jgi:hypothetical protein
MWPSGAAGRTIFDRGDLCLSRLAPQCQRVDFELA